MTTADWQVRMRAKTLTQGLIPTPQIPRRANRGPGAASSVQPRMLRHADAYRGEVGEPLRIQVLDQADWEQQRTQEELGYAERDSWLGALLPLPTQRSIPLRDETVSERVRRLARGAALLGWRGYMRMPSLLKSLREAIDVR